MINSVDKGKEFEKFPHKWITILITRNILETNKFS